jgi:hypothetical protein
MHLAEGKHRRGYKLPRAGPKPASVPPE